MAAGTAAADHDRLQALLHELNPLLLAARGLLWPTWHNVVS